MTSMVSILRILKSRLFAATLMAMCGCVVIHVDDRHDISTRVQTDIEMMREAMADIRELSTAFESFAVDNNFYPAASDSDRTVEEISLSNLERLSKELQIYGWSLPSVDPWGSPYLYWSDGKRYALICLGADAAIATPERLAEALRTISRDERVSRRESHCVEDDILLTNGILAWLPRDPVRRCS